MGAEPWARVCRARDHDARCVGRAPLAARDGEVAPRSVELFLLPFSRRAVPRRAVAFAASLTAFPVPVRAPAMLSILAAGFAGDDAPRAVFPSIVGRPRHTGVMVRRVVLRLAVCVRARPVLLRVPFSEFEAHSHAAPGPRRERLAWCGPLKRGGQSRGLCRRGCRQAV